MLRLSELEQRLNKDEPEINMVLMKTYLKDTPQEYIFDVNEKRWLENFKKYKKDMIKTYLQDKRIFMLIFYFTAKILPKKIHKLLWIKKGISLSKAQCSDKYLNKEAFLFPFMNGNEVNLEDVKLNFERYEKLFQQLKDKKSKQTLVNVLMARITAKEKYYQLAFDGEHAQYFDKSILKKAEQEVFVDGGGVYWRYCIEL